MAVTLNNLFKNKKSNIPDTPEFKNLMFMILRYIKEEPTDISLIDNELILLFKNKPISMTIDDFILLSGDCNMIRCITSKVGIIFKFDIRTR